MRDVKAMSPKPPRFPHAGGMTSSNVKIGAKLSHGVLAVLKSLHFALP